LPRIAPCWQGSAHPQRWQVMTVPEEVEADQDQPPQYFS
jgi:hypothetical protein